MLNKFHNFTTIEELVADESFQRYVIDSDTIETEYWENWQRNDVDRRRLVRKARRMVLDFALRPSALEIDLERQKLRNAILLNAATQKSDNSWNDTVFNPETTSQSSSSKPTISSPYVIFALATISIFLIGLSWYCMPNYKSASPTLLTTEFGEMLTHRLEDGSIVTLNGNSELEIFPFGKNSKERKLILKGEAFFNINPMPTIGPRSCSIITSKGIIQVHGTSFNVKDRASKFEVTLTEGAIDFFSTKNELVPIKVGEILTVNDEGNFLKKETTKQLHLAWKNHQLIFKDESITNVVERLKDDFGIAVTIENKALFDKKINAKINSYDPKSLLEAIAAIHQIELTQIDSRTFTLK